LGSREFESAPVLPDEHKLELWFAKKGFSVEGKHGSDVCEHRFGIVDRLMIIDLLCLNSDPLHASPRQRKSAYVDENCDLIASHHCGFFFFARYDMSFPQTAPNCWCSFQHGDVLPDDLSCSSWSAK
jgi:hypothetical protein